MLQPSIVFTVFLLLLYGCTACNIAGGGGTTLNVPQSINIGENLTFSMEFSVWGSGTGNLPKRYTNIIFEYQIDKGKLTGKVPAKILYSDDKKMIVEFFLPKESISIEGTLDYVITFLFDGHPNKSSGLIHIIGADTIRPQVSSP